MQLANEYDRIHGAGAEVVAMSVDDDGKNAGMVQRWGFTHTEFVGDPGGARYLRRMDLYDPKERDGLAISSVLLLRPDGTEAYRYVARDFADHTDLDELWEAVDGLQLPAVEPPAWTPPVEPPDDLHGFFPPSAFAAYFDGNFFGAVAIGMRLEDRAARAVARQHREMARSMRRAWDEWRVKAGIS